MAQALAAPSQTHNFADVKHRFKSAIRAIAQEHRTDEVDEAALPSYAHGNPLIDYIFWKRVRLAYDYANTSPGRRVLDFGCGSGVLSYALAHAGHHVTAIDLDFRPLRLVQNRIPFPTSIRFLEGDVVTQDIPERFDLIVALDVLEHIEPLQPYLERFAQLLTPTGVIFVSGPTENTLYKIGRRLAGQRFTGDYHVSNIHTIKRQFEQSFRTKHQATLLPIVPLFEVFTASGRNSQAQTQQ